MRIGIDASCWRNNRGFGRFTRELLRAIFNSDTDNEYILFTDDVYNEELSEYDVEVVRIGVNRKVIEAATANNRRSLTDIWSFSQAAARTSLDILFYPAVYSWFPPPMNVPSVVTFHDAIAEHYPELVFPGQLERIQWNAKTWLAKKSCDLVLTVSETAKSEIVEYLKLPERKISVICEGADIIFRRIDDADEIHKVQTKYGVPQNSRYLVYVGGFAPHKNLDRLLGAFRSSAVEAGMDDLRLLLVGDHLGGGFHSVFENLQRRIDGDTLLSSRVSFTGYVSDAELAVLYSGAAALVIPSLSEGFGLPALEAMSCGAPVLAAKGGAVMEVAGAAGLSFDPLNEQDIARAISIVVRDVKIAERLRARTSEEAKRNTWSRAADLTLAALASVNGKAQCAS